VKKSSLLEWRRNRQGYLYILPWVIGFLAFGLIPMIASLNISFLKWDGLTEPENVGLGNFIKLLGIEKSSPTSVLFWRSMTNNLLFMVFSGIGGLVLSFLMAAVMHAKVPGNTFFRVLFFLPTLVVPVAFGLLMVPVFQSSGGEDSQTGLINWVVRALGGQEINFIGEPSMAIWTLILTSYWYVGSGMIVFMAGMAGLPASYYEAAQLDGAGWWRRLTNITLPLLSPIIFFQTVMGLIGGLRVFDLAAALAGLGNGNVSSNMGPHDSLATLVYFLYKKGFRDFKFGEAAALGWIVFLLGLVLTILILTYMRRQTKDDVGALENV